MDRADWSEEEANLAGSCTWTSLDCGGGGEGEAAAFRWLSTERLGWLKLLMTGLSRAAGFRLDDDSLWYILLYKKKRR